MSRPTRGHRLRFPVRGCHPLRPAVPGASGTKNPCHWPVPRSLATTCGISRWWRSPPPRALQATPVLMSVPPATEMFQFAGFASSSYVFRQGYPLPGGLPHSEIPGSPIARISPGLFAACHVLHRLSVPRHPPDALLFALDPRRNQRLTHGFRRTKPPRTGARPTRTAASHEDTSSDTSSAPCFRRDKRRARPPRSHDKLSLHPSINTAARVAPDGVFRLLQTPVVEVNGFEPMTSCLQSRRSPS